MCAKSDKQIQLELLLEIAEKQKQSKDYETLIDIDMTSKRRSENMHTLSLEGCIEGRNLFSPNAKLKRLTPRGELKIVELRESIRQDRKTNFLLWMTAALLVMTAVLVLHAFLCR